MVVAKLAAVVVGRVPSAGGADEHELFIYTEIVTKNVQLTTT